MVSYLGGFEPQKNFQKFSFNPKKSVCQSVKYVRR